MTGATVAARIAASAHAAHFADVAHLTRAFREMFGLTPSALMRGEFAEIDSPFNVSDETQPSASSRSMLQQ